MYLEGRLIVEYVESAGAIARLEREAGMRMFAQSTEETNEQYELLFDMVLKLKPYIYNMHTVTQYYANKRNTQ
jgi:hypothetical protein